MIKPNAWEQIWEEIDNVVLDTEDTEVEEEDPIHQPLTFEEEASIRTRYNYW